MNHKTWLAAIIVLSSQGQAQAAAEIFKPQCATAAAMARALVALPAARQAEEFESLPVQCRADVAGAYLRESRDEAGARQMIGLAMKHTPCDPLVHLEIGERYRRGGQVELAACFIDKARGLTTNPQARQALDARYAQVASALPAVPTEQLECARVVGRKLGDQCTGVRSKGIGSKDIVLEASAPLRIEFAYDSDRLMPSGAAAVDKLAASLRGGLGADKGARIYRDLFYREEAPVVAGGAVPAIRLVGHTDERGADGYNESLSLRRAQRVREALLARLGGASIVAEGRGRAAPLVPHATREEEHQLNRRVEIFVR